MGYTHYWRRVQEFPESQFAKVVSDFQELLPELREAGVLLAGGMGDGEAEVSNEQIWFNGLEKCGHTKRDLGITWPADGAMGVHRGPGDPTAINKWFGGAKLRRRACGGDCSHETFHLLRVLKLWSEPDENGRYFQFCKTAYKPYDLAVGACLIIAKHYLTDAICVSSDGEEENWEDMAQFCKHFLGYPDGVKFDKEGDLYLIEGTTEE